MSDERYEISECELDVLAITGPEGTRYIDGEEIEARVIRQQSADIAELRAELAAAVAERDELARQNGNLSVRLAGAIARLSAIDAAPTVAKVCLSVMQGRYYVVEEVDANELPPLGTELIARPAKD